MRILQTICLILIPALGLADMTVKTDQGQEVILKDDGTWEYVKKVSVEEIVAKIESANKHLESLEDDLADHEKQLLLIKEAAHRGPYLREHIIPLRKLIEDAAHLYNALEDERDVLLAQQKTIPRNVKEYATILELISNIKVNLELAEGPKKVIQLAAIEKFILNEYGNKIVKLNAKIIKNRTRKNEVELLLEGSKWADEVIVRAADILSQDQMPPCQGAAHLLTKAAHQL